MDISHDRIRKGSSLDIETLTRRVLSLGCPGDIPSTVQTRIWGIIFAMANIGGSLYGESRHGCVGVTLRILTSHSPSGQIGELQALSKTTNHRSQDMLPR